MSGFIATINSGGANYIFSTIDISSGQLFVSADYKMTMLWNSFAMRQTMNASNKKTIYPTYKQEPNAL